MERSLSSEDQFRSISRYNPAVQPFRLVNDEVGRGKLTSFFQVSILRLPRDLVVPLDTPQEGAAQGRARARDAGEGEAEHQSAPRRAEEGRRGRRDPHRGGRNVAAQSESYGHQTGASGTAPDARPRSLLEFKITPSEKEPLGRPSSEVVIGKQDMRQVSAEFRL